MRRMERRGGEEGGERRIEKGGDVVSRRFATYISTQSKPFIAGSQAINKALEKLGEKPSFAFVVITSDYDKNVVLEALKKGASDVPMIGVMVDDIIYNEETITDKGVGVALWATDSADITPIIVKGLSRKEEDIANDIKKKIESMSIKRKYTYLLGVVPNTLEGLNLKISSALGKISEYLDAALVGVVGDFKPSPWSIVFNGETYSDHFAFVIIESDVKFGTLFAHGFHPSLPLKVTSAQDSVIIELNDAPVYEIFRNYLQRRGFTERDISDPVKASKILTKFQVAIADPSKSGRFKGSIIRSLDGNGMRILTDVSSGDTLWIMESSLEDMSESAQKGVQKALGMIQDAYGAGAIIFENSVRLRALEESLENDKSNLRKTLGLSFLGIPTVSEIVLHPEFYSGAHSGVMAGTLLANRVKQP